MSKSFRMQENVYNTFLKLKNRKKQQQFLEKCFIYAWENREIETDYDVDLAFCGVKPSIKLSNNGGGLNNPTGINGTKPLKNKETDMSDSGQSEVSVMSDSGQSFISNKDISNKENKIKETNKEKNKFIPPTLDEINKYIQEKNLSVDAKRFYDYYEAGGWTDSRGNKVKNWKQKMLVNWVKEEPQKQKEEEYKYWL